MNFKKIALLGTIIIMAITVKAQSLEGDWKGVLSVQGAEINLIFHVEKAGDAYTSTMDVPVQGAIGIPVEKTALEGKNVTFSIPAAQVVVKGTLESETITAEYEQMGQKFPLVLTKFEQTLPGNPALVSSDEELKALAALDKGDYKYKVADYFAKPKASSFSLSPNGKYMSYMENAPSSTKRHVYIKEIATGKVNMAIEEKDELIKGFGWINDERLYYAMDKGGDENFHIYGVDIDGSNAKDLTPYDGVKASIVNMLKDQKDYIIVSMNKNNPQVFEPYKLNIITGDIVQLYTNDDPANPIQGYDFDKDGELRGFTKMKDGVKMELYYKDLATGKFNLIKTMNWDESFGIIGFDYASDNKDQAYVVTNLDGDKSRIVLYDLKKGEVIKEVFAHPDYDVSNMARSRKRNYEIDYFSYNGEKNVLIPVSKSYKKFDAAAKKAFPNKVVSRIDYDDNEETYLVVVQSDKLYGTYYTYDVAKKKFTLLYDLMPQLKEEDMAEMRPITFKSRDGLTIHGYITLPKAALEGKKVPLIVNPHGGPQGIRDSWGFNPETQLFASRGYATLQVNFRISGGYGKEFLRAGFKQIGRKAMDDVEDGVLYVLEQGWVDKDKIAIYGASHGGYATLMGLIKTPDLYACGVDYVGVSNIETFFSSFPEYWKPLTEMVKAIWYDLDNPEEAKIAREVSPVFQVNKITKPLFVVQGANDPRVNINESDQIVEKLRARGFEVPYMVKYNEGHGFYREENSLEFYATMLGFLSKYLK
ncbi:MAG: S9 family peptidase [Tenuifilaceae bacterium]|nr:S9 family peptidase [Tenuifilaceae bacterium]